MDKVAKGRCVADFVDTVEVAEERMLGKAGELTEDIDNYSLLSHSASVVG